jgi:hypothetical protein
MLPAPAASAPIEIPEDIVERVSRLCLALPEVTVRPAGLAAARPPWS